MSNDFERNQSLLVDIEDLIATALHSINSPPTQLGRRSSAEVRTRVRGLLLISPNEVKQTLTRFFNAYSSLIDELNEGDLSLRDAQREFTKISRELSGLTSTMLALTKTPDSDETTTSALARNQRERTKLQSLITRKPVVLTEAPIVPMVYLDVARLKQHGVPATNLVPRDGSRATGLGTHALQGYASLDKQRVVGISREYIESIVDEKKAAGGKRRVKEGPVIEAAFQEVLDMFHTKHPGYEVLGQPTSWWEARWYWVIPKRELVALRKASKSALGITKWDFAFQS